MIAFFARVLLFRALFQIVTPGRFLALLILFAALVAWTFSGAGAQEPKPSGTFLTEDGETAITYIYEPSINRCVVMVQQRLREAGGAFEVTCTDAFIEHAQLAKPR